MMKFYMMLFFFIIIIYQFNKFLLIMMGQILMMLLMMMMMIKIPLMNLNFWMLIYYFYGVDFYSIGLIMLSWWITILMYLVSIQFFFKFMMNYYITIINLLMMFLIFSFSTMNLFIFYIYFESSLLPIFLLIMGFGYQIERIQAGVYMMMYTILGSIPLLLILMNLSIMNYSMIMDLININYMNLMFYLMVMMAFFVKMPMYTVHLWLPKAHVEAPIMGSMILAGVMLKLGSYGMLRMMLILMELSLKFNKFFIIFSIIGGIYSSLMCLNQIDMKKLVAYSSVVHMSILMAGMMTMFNWGYMGSYLMMLAHGLCSSGMFCLVNINYERFLSRSLYINKGLINIYPSLSLMWFLLCSSNLSFPPSLNLFSEIMLINTIIMWSNMMLIVMVMILFLSASYSLYLYSYSQQGKLNMMNLLLNSIKFKEFLLLLFHWIPLNFLFIYMYMY